MGEFIQHTRKENLKTVCSYSSNFDFLKVQLTRKNQKPKRKMPPRRKKIKTENDNIQNDEVT